MNRSVGWIVALACVAGCKAKPEQVASGTGSAIAGSGSATATTTTATTTAPDPGAKPCPPGNALSAGVCVAVVTPDKVAAIGVQKTRIDDLAALLDKTTTIATAVELLDGMRQLPAWGTLAAGNATLASVGDFIGVLGDGVKQLHEFQAGLKDAAARLGNLQGELDALLKSTGAAQQIADVRAKISLEVNGLVAKLQGEVLTTVQKVMQPIEGKLADISDLVIGACALAKMSGGSDQLKAMCGKAKDVFGQANAFLAELDKKPTELLASLTTQLQAQLGDLLDAESQKLLAGAQQVVNDALKLPAAGSGSAGSAGSGSGSAVH